MTHGYSTQTRLARQSLGTAWWVAAVTIPMLLTTLMVATRSGAIEDDLAGRTSAALRAAGMSGVGVTFAGRDAAVSVPANTDGATALQVVRSVPGVRSVSIGDGATARPTSPGEESPFTFERSAAVDAESSAVRMP